MYALIAILVSLLALVILLRLRVRIGKAMTISAVLLAILLRVTPGEMWAYLATEWQGRPLAETTPYLFVSLTMLLLLVNVVGEAMGQIGLSARLVPAMHGLFRSRRVALAAIPLVMGLLPTPAGSCSRPRWFARPATRWAWSEAASRPSTSSSDTSGSPSGRCSRRCR